MWWETVEILWYLAILVIGVWYLLPRVVRVGIRWTLGVMGHYIRTSLLPSVEWCAYWVVTGRPPPPAEPTGSEGVGVSKKEPVESWSSTPSSPTLSLRSLIDLDNIWVVGPKGSGKTTVLLYITQHRSGGLRAIDPHGYPGKWGRAEIIGAGREYGKIESSVRDLVKLIDSRAKELARGRAFEGGFSRETLFGDEWRSLVRAVPSIGGELGTILAEGRKFGVCSVVASHTDTAASIGLYGEMDLRDCFDVIIYLGGAARRKGGDLIPIDTEWPALAVFPQLGQVSPVRIPSLPPPPLPVPIPIPDDDDDGGEKEGEKEGERGTGDTSIRCPHCQAPLRNRQQRAASIRLGYCPSCKTEVKDGADS